ncbi:hypothetical protein [Hyalangium rubrum]|uniref:Lipoprotein n=1 Tax=Hyalangium rubrum TaxID=3103134 RepID=A0ABU5H133_9BACT|nr:hypothetical protein [Hyalangium sp. s54d21]MDY7226839.1 hypothetical protein [Hyalangium sp. s54d21]
MSLQPVVNVPGTLEGPPPEMPSSVATQHAQPSRAPALAPMWEILEAETRGSEAGRDEKVDGWSGQPWRRQLKNPRDYERQVARDPLVGRLLCEGHATDAEMAWLAGGIQAAASPRTLSIRQVVVFAEGLNGRIARARSDDELLQLVYLRRNAEDLAWRMLDWANSGRL